jgi:hypothetical protein
MEKNKTPLIEICPFTTALPSINVKIANLAANAVLANHLTTVHLQNF